MVAQTEGGRAKDGTTIAMMVIYSIFFLIMMVQVHRQRRHPSIRARSPFFLMVTLVSSEVIILMMGIGSLLFSELRRKNAYYCLLNTFEFASLPIYMGPYLARAGLLYAISRLQSLFVQKNEHTQLLHSAPASPSLSRSSSALSLDTPLASPKVVSVQIRFTSWLLHSARNFRLFATLTIITFLILNCLFMLTTHKVIDDSDLHLGRTFCTDDGDQLCCHTTTSLSLLLVTVVISSITCIVCHRLLQSVKEAFSINRELLFVLLTGIPLAAISVVVQNNRSADAWFEESNVPIFLPVYFMVVIHNIVSVALPLYYSRGSSRRSGAFLPTSPFSSSSLAPLHDASNNDIFPAPSASHRLQSVESILADDTFRPLFRDFLQKVFCVENYFFIERYDKFRQKRHQMTAEKVERFLMKTIDAFFLDSSEMQLNVPSSIFEAILDLKKTWKGDSAHVERLLDQFDHAYRETLYLLTTDALPRFLKSPECRQKLESASGNVLDLQRLL